MLYRLYKNQDEAESNIPKEELLKPMAVFPWYQTSRASVTSNALVGNETRSVSYHPYQVKGCASLELGAHALLKFTNKSGYDFGSSVVCLSHLIHTDPHSIHSSILKEVSDCIYRFSFCLFVINIDTSCDVMIRFHCLQVDKNVVMSLVNFPYDIYLHLCLWTRRYREREKREKFVIFCIYF